MYRYFQKELQKHCFKTYLLYSDSGVVQVTHLCRRADIRSWLWRCWEGKWTHKSCWTGNIPHILTPSKYFYPVSYLVNVLGIMIQHRKRIRGSERLDVVVETRSGSFSTPQLLNVLGSVNYQSALNCACQNSREMLPDWCGCVWHQLSASCEGTRGDNMELLLLLTTSFYSTNFLF